MNAVVALPLVFVFTASDPDAGGAEPPVVAVTAPDPLLLPPDQLPDGLRIDEIVLPAAEVAASAADLLRDDRGAQTLYRDASGERQLVVARSESSDTGGSFAPVGGGDPAELADGREATVLVAGSLTIVGWDESDFDDCDVCYQTGVAAGRGLEEEELLAVATGASVHEAAPTVDGDALPDDLEPVSTAPLLDQFEDLRGVAEQIIVSDSGGNQAMFLVYGGDEGLTEHLEFWIENGVHRGAAFGADSAVSTVEGSVVLAMSFGIDSDAVAEVLDGLRAGDAADVEAAIGELQSEPVTDADSCLDAETDPDHTAVLGGTTDDGARWVIAFGLSTDDGDVVECHELSVDGAQQTGGMSIGSPFDATADSSVIDIGLLHSGSDRGEWWVVSGTVTADAERVVVTFAGEDEPIEAQISDVGPTDDWRWFAIAVPAGGDDRPAVSAVGLDASGDEVATGTAD